MKKEKESITVVRSEEPKFIVNRNRKNHSIFVIIIVAAITGLIGGIIPDLLPLDDSEIINGIGEVTKKYEIETVDSPVVVIAQKVLPSVVGIKVTYSYEVFKGISTDVEGEGSGIIYSKDGYIVTNYHVIQDAIEDSSSKVEVAFYNSEDLTEATIVGYDKVTDLAVIKVEKTGLTVAEFNKEMNIKVGEIAVAIGNPLGQQLAGSVTSGVISAINRSLVSNGTTYKLIQTDAAINSGNSGGALVNSKGKVIGINTAKIVSTDVEGIGFAIPSSEAVPIIDQLIKNKKIIRPYIGVGGINITESMATAYGLRIGVYIQTVEDDSPASKAGIKQGDIIIRAGEEDITTMDEVNTIKYKYKVGDEFKITVLRDKKEVELTITLGEE